MNEKARDEALEVFQRLVAKTSHALEDRFLEANGRFFNQVCVGLDCADPGEFERAAAVRAKRQFNEGFPTKSSLDVFYKASPIGEALSRFIVFDEGWNDFVEFFRVVTLRIEAAFGGGLPEGRGFVGKGEPGRAPEHVRGNEGRHEARRSDVVGALANEGGRALPRFIALSDETEPMVGDAVEETFERLPFALTDLADYAGGRLTNGVEIVACFDEARAMRRVLYRVGKGDELVIVVARTRIEVPEERGGERRGTRAKEAHGVFAPAPGTGRAHAHVLTVFGLR